MKFYEMPQWIEVKKVLQQNVSSRRKLSPRSASRKAIRRI